MWFKVAAALSTTGFLDHGEVLLAQFGASAQTG